MHHRRWILGLVLLAATGGGNPLAGGARHPLDRAGAPTLGAASVERGVRPTRRSPDDPGMGVEDPGCPTTLQALVDRAAPGSVVVVPPCTFRETVTVAKPLTLDGGGRAEVRGSDVWSEGWTRAGEHWVRGTLPRFRTGGTCAADSERCRWPEQVFLDGRPLEQVAADPAPGQFAVDGERRVVLADDPAGRLVEVTTRARWLRGAAAGVTVRGFAMRHAASPAQDGALGNGGYADWTVVGNTLSDAHGAVVSLRGAAGLRLEGNDIARGGGLGVHGTAASGTVVRANTIHHNNTEGFEPEWEAGGLKMTRMTGLVVEGNEVHANAGPGIWCDIGCRETTIHANRVHHNARGGIAYEISRGGRIVANRLWENGWDKPIWAWGAAILVQNSRDTEVVGNLLAWNADGIAVVSQDRGDDANRVVGNRVRANTVVWSDAGGTALGWFEDWSGPLYLEASANRGEGNRYWHAGSDGADARYVWDRPYLRLADFNATPGEEDGALVGRRTKDRVLAEAAMPPAPEPPRERAG